MVILCAAVFAAPAPAAAQRALFFEAFSEFASTVEGTFGDEGPHIGAALDRMTRALEEWDRSIQALAEAAASAPGDGSATRVKLALMYAERGRPDAAARELGLATRLEPQRADLHRLRGLVLEASGRAAEAGEAFRRASALDAGDPIATYLLYRHARRAGESVSAQRARAALAEAEAERLEHPQGERRTPFPAVAPLHDAGDTPPLLPLARYAEGYARLASGDYAGAIAEFRRVATADPLVADPAAQSPDVRRATAALRQGRLDEARALLQRAGNAPASSSEAFRLAGLISWAGSEYDRSISELSRAVAERPEDERARLALARVLSSAGRYAEAERALEETTALLPASGLAWWWLGAARERLNDLAGARAAFERAASAAVAGRATLYASIGRLALDGADVPGAVEAFTEAAASSPNAAELHRLLAGALLQMDRTDEAHVELVAALAIDPFDADAYALVGRIHLDAGRLDRAALALRRAIELSPMHLPARYALAAALRRQGNASDAEREFERVAEVQRQRLAARRRTLSLEVLKEEAGLRTAEGRHDVAAELWRQAIDLEPGDASNHLAFAEASARAGRTEAAIAGFENAIARGAGAAAYRRIAELHERVGRLLEAARARAMYEKAARQEPPAAR